jgi:RHS repeat-associated protein
MLLRPSRTCAQFVYGIVTGLWACFLFCSLTPQALGQPGYCRISPSSFKFGAAGGSGDFSYSYGGFVNGSCAPGIFSVQPPNAGGNSVCIYESLADGGFCSSAGSANCSSETDTYQYASSWENGHIVGFGTITVSTSGIGGIGCAIQQFVSQSLGGPSPRNPQATTKEPISTGTGNYFYQHADLTSDRGGLREPLSFIRTYNAQDSYSGRLGNNWTDSLNLTLASSTTGVVVKLADGGGESWNLVNGVYVPAPGVQDTLTVSSNWIITKKDGTQYSFEPFGKLQTITDRNGNQTSLNYDRSWNLYSVSSEAGTFNLSYDAFGRLTGISDLLGRAVSYSYDANSNLVSFTDAAGGITKYAYDASNRLTSITLPDGSTLMQNVYDSQNRVVSQANARGYATTLAYDTPAAGQTTITDPLGNKTVHTYDSSMRITGITDALVDTTTYSYDANNNVVVIQDARGNISKLTYDGMGNVLGFTDPLSNVASFTYNQFSEPLTVTNPNGKALSFTYDTFGNLVEVQDPLGNTSKFTYNSFGQTLSATDSLGNNTTLTYADGIDLSQVTDPLKNATKVVVDLAGRLTSITDANGHTSSIVYDPLNRITSLTDALGNVTQFSYDLVGNLAGVTDALSRVTGYTYDPTGNLSQVTDALGHKTNYAYDPNNNRTGFTNARSKTTSFGYDAVNRVISVSDPLKNKTSYGYDANGNPTSLKDANGKINTFAYDADNRLQSANYSDGKTVRYTYDPDGNRLTMADSHGTTTYGYDAVDRILSVAFPGAVQVGYGYDAAGNRTVLQYPDGTNVQYGYDADNRLSTVMDWLGRTTSYSYDPVGNLTGITYPNATAGVLTYDAANRLTGIKYSANNVAFRVLSYALDKVGNRLSLKDRATKTTFTYDKLNELLSAAVGTTKTSWVYDAAGNRTKQTAGSTVTTYTYDAADRMLTAGATAFTYDKNGNRLTAGNSTFSYDAMNRLLTAVTPSGTSAFGYDGDGNRITQTIPAGTYDYVNDTALSLPVVVNEAGPDGTIDYAYSLGLGPLESSSSAFSYFYHPDGLGSVINLTDATGKVQETYAYDAWGGALSASGSVGTQNKFRYTGQELDPVTGLYFLRARYYDPLTGRFGSKDPLGLSGDDTNLYRYARNGPITHTDPSGFDPWLYTATRAVIPTGIAVTVDVVNWILSGEKPNFAIDVVTSVIPGGTLPGAGGAVGILLDSGNAVNIANGVKALTTSGGFINSNEQQQLCELDPTYYFCGGQHSPVAQGENAQSK